jgi:hypothetical protein
MGKAERLNTQPLTRLGQEPVTGLSRMTLT